MSDNYDHKKYEEADWPSNILLRFFQGCLMRAGWLLILIALTAVGVYTLLLPFLGQLASLIVSVVLALLACFVIVPRVLR